MAVTVTIRNGSSTLSADSLVRQGVLWLPLRRVIEGLGGTVHWDPATESVIVALGNDRLQIQVDQQRAVSNSTPIALLSAPEIHDGVTYMTWFDLSNYLPIDVEMVVSSPDPTPPQPLAGVSLCIDPGHGGTDPGAQGPSGLLEKEINLSVALKLAKLLRQSGASVIMTRSGDQTRSLSERSSLANNEWVDWFVSIHCNSFSDPAAQGTETFYYPGDESGRRLAISIQSQLVAALGRFDRGVKTGDLHVIRETNMPAILTELAFISNTVEEQLLADPQVQQRAAQAIYQGLASVVTNT